MSTVITVHNLGKMYTLSPCRGEDHASLRDMLSAGMSRLGNRLFHPFQEKDPTTAAVDFWALRDVSFEVKQGERLGVIGNNGAGKSTLLKILSRITEPTTGSIQIKGRVASLLEVGTGFHPELTGRENIYLNGAILGMGRREIRGKFDEIVEFSEIEKFLDTPVKRYSSGMYVRLAFAVAAHMEPEILIVDEVLAVGDAAFQKKCIGKMKDVGSQGRTVLFVSHNMQAIRQLCDSALQIRSGKVVAAGETSQVIDSYLQDTVKMESLQSIQEVIAALPADPTFKLLGIALTQSGQAVGDFVESGKPLQLEIRYQVFERTTGLRVYFDLCDDMDTIIFRSFNDECSDGIPVVGPGEYTSRVQIPADVLGPLHYQLRVRATIFNQRSCLPLSGVGVHLTVQMTGKYNRAYLTDTFRGRLGLSLDWMTHKH